MVAGAVLTGCGSKTVQTRSAPISVNPSSPSPSVNPAGGTMTKAAITKPVNVSGQDRTLTVSTVTSGCKTAALVSHESTASVTLVVEVTDHRKPGEMCPDMAKLARVSTTLKAPLDKRQVFDGATGKQVRTQT
jgi:hypothetical protein